MRFFGPDSRRSPGGLKGFFRKFEKREMWLAATRNGQKPFDKETAEHLADWLAWLVLQMGRIDPDILCLLLPACRIYWRMKRNVRRCAPLFKARRDTYVRTVCSSATHSRGQLRCSTTRSICFLSQTVNCYDLFHLLRSYRLNLLMNRNELGRLAGDTDLNLATSMYNCGSIARLGWCWSS